MSDMDTQDTMRLAQEATERIRSGQSESEKILLPKGGVLRIFRDDSAEGRVVVEAQSGGSILRSYPFPSASEHPGGYPMDIPFLPGSASILTEAGEGRARTMVWPNPLDPDGQFEAARVQLVDMGWEETARSERDTEFGGVQSVDFLKGGVGRSLFLNRVGERAQLMTVDHPPMKEEG